jgi:glycosyltransferase involved in cell wall biosynthesis
MNKLPLVSVALCVYNGEKHLKEQLESILNQDYQNIEIIAVDDCSSDNSRIILETYAEQNEILKIFTNDINLGYVKNFEKAIQLSNGKYIALADQDDIWLPQKISTQVDGIGENILIYHDSEFIDEDGHSLDKKMSDILDLYEGSCPLPFVFMNCVSGHTVMFERSLINHALPFNQSFFHDWWLAFTALNVGSIKVSPFPLVKYRQHPKSTIDFLGLKENVIDHKKPEHELLLKKEWVKFCSSYKGVYSSYLKKIYNLISPDISFIGKMILFYLLAKNRKEFLIISKTPATENLKAIRKLVFSLNNQ